ncbi:NAD(P)-dependent alcohol dehydrogenase [Paenibacillus wynnii]|uniref:NAD(P)-dependent alcohol dehydrogenase n=1 Tax=Paenibacillus wynnii TaxID=268407 RepID=UPI00278E7C42|nr:NAD(P)-dependent alcohol dehydrogenase [Paenibacillus wynnii]MDQ0193388.1 NADPH:quinone reductase-like Zn-dependent oxidoreductase [Paenibacillus wynnii]
MKMKAIVSHKYGSPDILQFKEVNTPTPKENEALVKVYATSLNAADLETLRGTPMSRFGGLLRPKHKILGTDIAGRVEAVGSKVMQFQSGDEIWGDLSFPHNCGAFAEYVCIPEQALRLKPASMTFEEAAAIPTSAIVALQNLCGKRPIQPGQKVLINGAGGGVGTFAVQLAKHFGAEVTGVDNAGKLDLLRSIGAWNLCLRWRFHSCSSSSFNTGTLDFNDGHSKNGHRDVETKQKRRSGFVERPF